MNTTIAQNTSSSQLAKIEKWIPGLGAIRNYERSWLPRDLVAGLVLLMLLFLPGLVSSLPQSVLAAIVIVASISLFDLPVLRHLRTVRKSEFTMAIISALGVALIGVLEGILIAVIVSIFQIFFRAWHPHTAVLGKPKDVPGYHDLKSYPEAKLPPRLLLIRWDSEIFLQTPTFSAILCEN